jgi:D-arabinan exo alpha-(1,3)/(1,5)-arabinofuranosidase (non-reducing end)
MLVRSAGVCLALLVLTSAALPQTLDNDFLDPLGLARLKNYSSGRTSSGNRYVNSNDDSKRIMPGETLVMADVAGPGMITHIWLTVAHNEFGWPRLVRLRVYYDGAKTPGVDAPLGDFFAVGHGAERDVNSMMVRDSSFGRARNSYWPMPFQKSCRITVTNEGKRLLPMFYYHVDYRKYASPLPADIAYFHAYYRQERPARAGHNYAFLETKGTGHYVGTVMSVVLTQISWFGEGDDLFYIDGTKQPQIYGTGTEDYFNDAWDLRDASALWTGTPIAEGELPGSRLSAYRWHVPDPIPFTNSIWAGIEHSGWTSNPDGSVRSGFEQRPDYFSSVAFWYQKGVNELLPEPPYGAARLPFGNATQIAVEDSVNDVTTEHGKAVVLRDVDWAKDLLLFKADGVGSKINLPIDIPEDGQYEIVAQLAESPDYGDYIALLDGTPTNVDTRQPMVSEIPLPGPEVFRNYLTELYVARDRTLGLFSLKKGRHTVSFVCQGKDTRSVGYNLGINEMVLEKVQKDETSTEGSPMKENDAEGNATGPLYRGRPLSYYLANFKTASGDERVEWIRVFGYFGADGVAAVPQLTAALSEFSPVVRSAAAGSLAQIGPAAAEAVPALAKALSDESPQVRDVAAIALREMGPKAAAAVPELIRALGDPVNFVRAPAADALGAIGAGAQAAVAALAERLLMKDEEGFVLTSVAYALGDIGPVAKDALPALHQVLEKRRVGGAAEEAILKIEGKPVPTYHP